jgi:type III secretory pathway lipoprotein EscJ
MTTFTSLEEDAKTILAMLKQRGLNAPDLSKYPDLRGDAQKVGIDQATFDAAIKWLADHKHISPPSAA